MMISSDITSKVNWYGQDHIVKVSWESDNGDLISARCMVDGKEIVKFFRGKWTNKKGNKRYDSDHFIILKRCCVDNFKDSKNMLPAFMPIFSIIHGEEM